MEQNLQLKEYELREWNGKKSIGKEMNLKQSIVRQERRIDKGKRKLKISINRKERNIDENK